jgi:transposase
MSLHPQHVAEIPEETVRVAQAAFPKGNLYMQMRDELGTFYQDDDFVDLFPRRGQPAANPWRLALVLVMQFAEGLSDRQAAEAVRARIDWKYALSLELTDPGFDYSVLSEFRQRLLAGSAESRLLDGMLERFKAKGYLKARGKQRTDSTHVLASVRQLNRLESVGETLRAALNSLAQVAPEWLRRQASGEWFERYGRRVEEYRLPKGEQSRAEYAGVIGADGFCLLAAVDAQKAQPELRELAAVKTLRQLWEVQFIEENGKVRLRTAQELGPAGGRFDSPYDPEAHFGNKRSITWVGYKVHFTETCDEDQVHLITNVETTNAVIPDVELGQKVHEALDKKDLLPKQHLVDAGYVDAQWLVESQQQHEVTVIGPVRQDIHWQARTRSGFDLSRFEIDWENKQVTCPAGQKTRNWYSMKKLTGQDWTRVRFNRSQCDPCTLRASCTKAQHERSLLFRSQAQHEALQTARAEQLTPEWKKEYERRAGIEGTISQGVRAFGLRQARYIGRAKTHLQNIRGCQADCVSGDNHLPSPERSLDYADYTGTLRRTAQGLQVARRHVW